MLATRSCQVLVQSDNTTINVTLERFIGRYMTER
jgi:hypothetical protein